MRISKILIRQWRTLRDVEIVPPPTAPIICLVGENGSGKSSVLELLNATAFALNVPSQAIGIRNPFADEHDFEVTVDLNDHDGLLRHIQGFGYAGSTKPSNSHGPSDPAEMWDGTVKIESWRREDEASGKAIVTAGGVANQSDAHAVGDRIRESLPKLTPLQLVYIDSQRHPPADREEEWDIWHKKEPVDRLGYDWRPRSTADIRSRWIDQFLDRERRAAEAHWAFEHQAKLHGRARPEFKNPNAFFGQAVHELLPHVSFVRADLSSQDLLFDVSGNTVPLRQMSSGEQEVVFLAGLLEPLSVEHGVLAIDEPELRLNPALIDAFLTFVRRQVLGQTWLATHSYDVVRHAGTDATFLFSRSGQGIRVSSLELHPVLATIGAAMGWPAFSLAHQRLIFVEGSKEKRSLSEDHRFTRLLPTVGSVSNTIHLCNGTSRVQQQYQWLQRLSADSSSNEHDVIKVGAVVDRDHHSSKWVEEKEVQGIHVLACFEIENMFLHPGSIARIVTQSSADEVSILDLIRSQCERKAGNWIYNRAAELGAGSLSREAQGEIRSLEWVGALETKAATSAHLFSGQERKLLNMAIDQFVAMIASDDVWMYCEGKEIEKAVAVELRFAVTEFERALFDLWDSEDKAIIPWPLLHLREYIANIGIPNTGKRLD